MSTDIKIDPNTNDYLLTGSSLSLHTESAPLVAQRIRIAVQTGQGELFNNVLEGIPFQISSRLKGEEAFAEEFMKDYIANVEGVAEVVNFQSSLDPHTRIFNVKAAVRIESGDLITIDTGG